MVTKHYFFAGQAFWGHLRPAIAVCSSLLTANEDIQMTLLVPSSLAKPAAAELQRYPFDYSRFKIIHGGQRQSDATGLRPLMQIFQFMEETKEMVKNVFTNLIARQPVVDSITNETITPFETPISVVIVDFGYAGFALDILKAITTEAGVNVKFLMQAPLSGPYATWGMTQDALGPYTGYLERALKIAAAGQGFDASSPAYNEHLKQNEDLVHVPGNGPTYVYEQQPIQDDFFLGFMPTIIPRLHEWDGLVLVWPTILSKEFQSYWDNRKVPLMQIGPQVPDLTEGDLAFGTSGNGPAIKAFLDEALEEDGAKSVLYISFGSLFFGPSKTQAAIMLEVLDQLRVRYILVEGNAPEDVRETLVKKVRASAGRGLLVKWSPQFAILAHPATGFFLTHGGSNSFMEAIRMRTPLILWPCSGDQVQTASAADQVYGCGYELLQIRTGYNVGRKAARGPVVVGTNEALRTEFVEVFGGMQGELGSRLRRGMEKVADDVEKDCAPGGGTWQAIRRLASM